jgi:hypothetical protein
MKVGTPASFVLGQTSFLSRFIRCLPRSLLSTSRRYRPVIYRLVANAVFGIQIGRTAIKCRRSAVN